MLGLKLNHVSKRGYRDIEAVTAEGPQVQIYESRESIWLPCDGNFQPEAIIL